MSRGLKIGLALGLGLILWAFMARGDEPATQDEPCCGKFFRVARATATCPATGTPSPPPTPVNTATPTVTPTPTIATLFAQACYTGNGLDNRSISGVGFSPSAVLLHHGSGNAVLRTTDFSGDDSAVLGSTTSTGTNRIQAFESDGFQVGTDANVNTSSIVYCYIAWKASAGKAFFGTYSGNATNPRAITGVGFAPEVLLLIEKGGTNNGTWIKMSNFSASNRACAYFSCGSSCCQSADTIIKSLDADGFTVGTVFNESGATYYYLTFRAVSPTTKWMTSPSTYTGNNVASRAIASGCGNTDGAQAVFVRGDVSSTTVGCPAWRLKGIDATQSTFQFATDDSSTAGGFDDFSSGDFTAVHNGIRSCNASANTYYFFAFCDGS